MGNEMSEVSGNCWSEGQILMHRKAGQLLEETILETRKFIAKNNSTESEANEFVLRKYAERRLATDDNTAIIAFNENSAIPHYYPKENSKRLEEKALVLIDVWAKLGKPEAPYADITRVFVNGKEAKKEFRETFEVVAKARDECIEFIKSKLVAGEMPLGIEADNAARKVIAEAGFEKNILHGTGHCLGTEGPHGLFGNINQKNGPALEKNLGYTIEPGVYFENRFGIRSEMDFFIDGKMRFVHTAKLQRELDEL